MRRMTCNRTPHSRGIRAGRAAPGLARIPRAAAAGLVLLAGCTLADVKVEVVSERTALENQVLGTYNSLDSEMLMVASVRGVDSSGRIQHPPRQSQEQRDAVLAMQVLAFHADDLEGFKRLGWVGENAEGLLTAFDMEKDRAPEDLRAFAARYGQDEFKAVVDEVNEARGVVMRRVVELNPDLSAEDLPKVRRVFARLNAEQARPGEKVQLEDGTWTEKR